MQTGLDEIGVDLERTDLVATHFRLTGLRLIQAHIQDIVERYARMRGFERISTAVVQEARENLMDGR